MPNIGFMVRRVDWPLFLCVLALAALGLLAIWSVDLVQDPEHLLNFKKQMTFVGGGFIVALVLAAVDYRAWRALVKPLYIGGLALLLAVLFFGTALRGTKGWFVLGSWTFQPVELAKVILILTLAKYLAGKGHIIDRRVLVGAVVLIGAYVAATLAQPDFGSAFVLLAAGSGMLLVTSVPRRYLVLAAVVLTIVATVAWSFFLADYQKDRVISFLNPASDPFGRGYNLRQSVIAVGAGGIFGRGLGQGSQSQLRFLPEAQTDFIFAVLAEQLGFVVVLIMLGAYGLLWSRLVRLLRTVTDGFALFVVAGFGVMLALQAVMNMAMNLGLLPIVGLPLPFVSLGGSAMLTNFILLGVVQSIRVRG